EGQPRQNQGNQQTHFRFPFRGRGKLIEMGIDLPRSPLTTQPVAGWASDFIIFLTVCKPLG
ncbi:MAG: hypothetical protein LBI48_02695, partial [Burkholderiaceae bacterium]|nr:hypothetical protein [Burkholderiaceae bacterium]